MTRFLKLSFAVVLTVDTVRFFSNLVNLDLALGVEIIPGKFYQNQLYRMGMHSKQTDKLSSLHT